MKANANQILEQIITDNAQHIREYNHNNISEYFKNEFENQGNEYLFNWFCTDDEIQFLENNTHDECKHIYNDFFELLDNYTMSIDEFLK